jgi:type II secretory pathway pseudopilin PulG
MAFLMLVTPSGHLLAQDVPPIDMTYVLPQACLVVSARPQAIYNSPMFQMMPLEVLQAASIQHIGIDALEMDRLLISMEPPLTGPPDYSVFMSFTSDVAGKLVPEVTKNLEEQVGSERPHFKNPKPIEPSLYFPTDTTILATSEDVLQKFLTGGITPYENNINGKLGSAAGDDLYVAVDVAPLRPMINMALMQAEIPMELGYLYEAPNLIKSVEFRINVSNAGTNELVIDANNAADAEKLEQILVKTADLIKAQANAEIARLKADADPVQQALGRYQERMLSSTYDAVMPKREGEKFVIFRVAGEGSDATALTTVAISGILVALLLPAVQAAREAARRNSSMNNMKQINLALHNYADMKKAFPAHANYSADGKPLLSWRVHILPFLEQQALYDQFHLDEPWDSEHNKKLIPLMPPEFLDPSSKWQPANGKTHYLGVVGEKMIFNGTDKGTTFAGIRDGTANTIMLVQVNDDRAATWSKPDDWQFDEKNPLNGLIPNMHPGTFLASFADAHVRAISGDVDLNWFKGALTRAGNELTPLP